MERHTSRSGGDHSRALAFFKEEMADLVVEVQPQQPRKASTSDAEQNLVYLAYLCLQMGLSGCQYQKIAHACHRVGAAIPNSHLGQRFYRDLTDAAGVFLFKQVLELLRSSPVISVNCDEGVLGSGFFVIRVHCLGKNGPVSAFYQARLLHSKTADDLCAEVLRAFCESPGGTIPPHLMLSKQECLEKLIGFCADGAPVMGTQRRSRPVAAPVPGSASAQFGLTCCLKSST